MRVWRWSVLLCPLAACSSFMEGPDVPDKETPTPPALPYAAPDCSNGRSIHIYDAVDGDTVSLTVWNEATDEYEKVRLVGVDTPESWPKDEAECYGPESAEFTHTLVADLEACLTYDPAVTAQSGNIDPYGRTLGYIFFGEEFSRFLNAELLSGGYAEDYPYTRGAVFESLFAELEAQAKEQELGRWSVCGDFEKHGRG